MSKILIHIGPPKTGTTQLQTYFYTNSQALSDKSIDYLNNKLEKYIESYIQAYRKNKKMKTPLPRAESSLKPWYLKCPATYFAKKPSHDYAIISEERLFKFIKFSGETSSFDQFLSTWYSDREYLAVLREINGSTVSNISQKIRRVWRFDYRQCRAKLKRFSLDKDFADILDADLSLKISTFNYLIVDSRSPKRISSLLEDIFGVSKLDIKKLEGIRNASLSAEGTGVFLAYNNIMQMVLGDQGLNQTRREVHLSGQQLQLKIRDQFASQRKFCPYTKNEQSMFHELQLAKSQRFINRFSGSWMDEVFTPVIREKAIALVSEFESPARKVAIEILESQVHETVDKLSLTLKLSPSIKIREAVQHFLKNERSLVL